MYDSMMNTRERSDPLKPGTWAATVVTWKVSWHSGLSFLIWKRKLVVKMEVFKVFQLENLGHVSAHLMALVCTSLAFRFLIS